MYTARSKTDSISSGFEIELAPSPNPGCGGAELEIIPSVADRYQKERGEDV